MACLLLGGFAVATLHLLLGWLRLRFLLATSKPAPASLRDAVKLPDGVQLLTTDRRVQPFCCGVGRGRIVLPQTMADPTPATLFVLQHEVAHLRNGDVRWRVLAALLRPLLFWHPLFWWLQQQLRFTGELLADDHAAKGAVANYVRCMLALAEQPPRRVAATLTTPVFFRSSELYRRLQVMLQRKQPLPRSTPWRRTRQALPAALIAISCVAGFGIESATAQAPEQSRTELRTKSTACAT